MKKFPVSRDIIINMISALTLLTILVYGPKVYSGLNIIENTNITINIVSAIVLVFWIFKSLSLADSHHKPKVFRVGACTVVVALSIPVFYSLIVIFGAPFTERLSETFQLALLMSALCVVPPASILGPELYVWIRVFFGGSYTGANVRAEISVWSASVFSLFGTWLGALPIPLDWDRPWQVWPISCAIGCILGHALGLLASPIFLILDHRAKEKNKLI